MSDVLFATVAGLVTAFCWGTADWLAARGAKKLSPIAVNFGTQISSFVIAMTIWLVFQPQLPEGTHLLRVVIGSLLITSAFVVFVKALSSGVVGIVVPIGNSYPLITILLAVILLGLVISPLQYAAFVCILIGAAVLAYEKNHRKVPLKELHRDTALACLAAVIWGVGFFVLDPVVSELSWQALIVTSEIVFTVFATLLFLAIYRRNSRQVAGEVLASRIPLLVGIAGTTGLIALYIGSNKAGNIIIPAVLSSLAPLVASLWGALADHEKIGVFKRAGAVILVCGIILLNLA